MIRERQRMRPTVQRATLNNLGEMCAIEQQCFTQDTFSRRQLRYLLTKAKACSWIALLESTAIAYSICLTPVRPRPARLYSLAVLSQYRQHGVATQLLNVMTSALVDQHYTQWTLEVNEHNQRAKQLYIQHGFTETERIEGYYYNGDAAIRMCKSLLNDDL